MTEQNCSRCQASKPTDSFRPPSRVCLECRKQYIKSWRLERGDTKHPRGTPKVDFIGKSFGMLTVIGLVEGRDHNQYRWLCRCQCGSEKVLRTSVLNKRKSCGCLLHQSKAKSRNWKGVGELSAVRWHLMKNKASRRGLEFSISPHYMWDLFEKQGGKCALTGESIDLGRNKNDYGVASLDRIDSKRGYVEGNVQWVHRVVNFMKQSLSDEDFVRWCKKVVSHSIEKG